MTATAPLPPMPTTRPAASARGPRVDRIAWSVAEVGAFHRVSASWVRKMLAAYVIAYVTVSPGGRWRRVVILEGDITGTDGPAMLARCFRGRQRLRLAEIAAALGVSLRTLQRLARTGELPTTRGQVARDTFVRWLLRNRVPAQREIAA